MLATAIYDLPQTAPVQRIAREAKLFPDFGLVIPDRTVPRKSSQGSKIALPTLDGLCFEKIKDITFLEASGNYTLFHFDDGRQVLVCKTLGEVESMVPMEMFARIHRSHIVNLRHLKKYVRGKGGFVVLQNGATLNVSAGQKDLFLEAVRGYFG